MKTLRGVLTALVATGGMMLAVGGAAMAAPATTASVSDGHVNRNVAYTYVYDNYSGANAVGSLSQCESFQYTGYYNGRYHIYGGPYNGLWVSTSTTSPGSSC